MKKLLTLLGLLITIVCTAQNQNKLKYFEYMKQAEWLFELGDYKASAEKYEEGFKFLDGKVIRAHRYNASCAYSLSKNKEKAFFHLFKLAKEYSYKRLNHLKNDKDLNNLHSDLRWQKLISLVENNKKNIEKNFDKKLIAKLDTIFKNDQKYRHQYENVLKKYGENSKEIKKLLELNKKSDSINLIEVKKILDTRGWLGKNVIGAKGNITLFLVIQHSDIKTQLKYLPMIKDAVKKGNANPSNLAMLEDRIALRQGKKQIYGSQILTDKRTNEKYVAPLIDPKNVDKRRLKIGLSKLAEYTQFYGFTWNLEKHLKRHKK